MRKKFRLWVVSAVLAIGALVFLYPLLLTFTNSFMSEQEIEENYSVLAPGDSDGQYGETGQTFVKLKLIPDEVVLKQYYTVLIKRVQFLFMVWNSVFIAVPVILGQMAVASMAAFAFAKIDFKGRNKLFFMYIVVMLMPFQVTLVPNYIVASRLGLVGGFSSIILPGIFGTFGVFLLRQYMLYIPDAYMEAARVDGAGYLKIFTKVVLPMSRAGLAALAILLFIDSWNMVEQPLVFLNDAVKQPLSVYLSRINDEERGVAFAAASVYMLPMLLMFLYGENYLVEGIQLSGIKG